MVVDRDDAVNQLVAAFARMTSVEKADMARRQPDLYGPIVRLAAGAKFALSYAD